MLGIFRFLMRPAVALLLIGLVTQLNCAGQSEEAGSDCSELCKKGMRECPELPRVDDCEMQCLGEDARAERTGCRKRVNAVARCSAALDDICTTATACKPELEQFWSCIAAYCATHPGAMDCG